jgi:hypothetical protein
MRDAGLADQFGRLYCHSDWGSGTTTATILATLQGGPGHSSHRGTS